MAFEFGQLGAFVLTAAALVGWWLAVRPGSSYRGIGGTMSVLIVLMAVLMSLLATHEPARPARGVAPAALISARY